MISGTTAAFVGSRQTPRRQDAKTPGGTDSIRGVVASWRRGVGILVVCWVTLVTSTIAAPTTRPTTAIDPASCVTSDCHANIKSSPAIHGPVADNHCNICHEPADVAAHTYRLRRSGEELCTYCHEFDVAAMPVIHTPVSKGECLGCHNPHGGRDRSFTGEASMQALCYRCHENAPSDHEILHTPVKAGQCTSCHPPHASMFPKLLDAAGTDLCLACHGQFDQSLASVRSVHEAMEKGCEKCHDPHGSAEQMQLVKSTADLCLECHEPIKERIAAASFRHSSATSGRACLTCHTPHGGDAISLLNDQPITLCMGCHKDPIKHANGRTIPAIAELTRIAMHQHGAIRDGECGGCHEPHGTTQAMLLTKRYSTQIYQAFSIEQFELCFSCHDTRLVKSEQAGGVTNFRNGERNLHWVHVKENEFGRACAMCHTTHASTNERNIRDTVSFKLWTMPIRFTATDTGGSCAPGCHEPWTYDRENAVSGPTSRPVEPMPAPRARTSGPVMLTLRATDTQQRDVRIPCSQPAILAFTRDDTTVAVRLMGEVDDRLTDARRILVISGPDARDVSAKLPAGGWSVVLDPDCRLAGELQVHGWPTTMVVQGDGMKVIELSGATPSLGLKLPLYLELAAGTLDQAAVERVLKHPVTASDGEPESPQRRLIEARRLLAANQPEQALRILTDTLPRDPESAELQIEMIRALLANNRPDDALVMLSKLAPSALPPSGHDLLRARALLGKYHWVDARNLLLEIVKKHPEIAEAHFLLGTLYERDGEWQQAAEAYRKASGSR